jgi:hypothetical protein
VAKEANENWLQLALGPLTMLIFSLWFYLHHHKVPFDTSVIASGVMVALFLAVNCLATIFERRGLT